MSNPNRTSTAMTTYFSTSSITPLGTVLPSNYNRTSIGSSKSANAIQKITQVFNITATASSGTPSTRSRTPVRSSNAWVGVESRFDTPPPPYTSIAEAPRSKSRSKAGLPSSHPTPRPRPTATEEGWYDLLSDDLFLTPSSESSLNLVSIEEAQLRETKRRLECATAARLGDSLRKKREYERFFDLIDLEVRAQGNLNAKRRV